jgi:hypothetical protein
VVLLPAAPVFIEALLVSPAVMVDESVVVVVVEVSESELLPQAVTPVTRINPATAKYDFFINVFFSWH